MPRHPQFNADVWALIRNMMNIRTMFLAFDKDCAGYASDMNALPAISRISSKVS